jgi:GT2 family glycosyltransferase
MLRGIRSSEEPLKDSTLTRPRVTAVVLAYGAESWLERSVHALLDSDGVDVDVVLVDNGCTDGAVGRLEGSTGVIVTGDRTNLGFAGGCNRGASLATGEYLALVNGDLIVEPDAIARLVDIARVPDVGIAAGSVRLSDDPTRLNTAGNKIHFLGFSWVGGFGESAATTAKSRDIAGAMGALALMRKRVWNELGGFAEQYFAFHEDADLSWRCWQRGLRVHYVANAVGIHRYEFDREPRKLYLAERNRLIFVITCWDRRTLALLAPPLVAMEAAVSLVALNGGWFGDKVAGWRWLYSNREWLLKRRSAVQRARTVNDRRLAPLMSTRLDARNFPIPDALRPFDALLGSYWRLAKLFLR